MKAAERVERALDRLARARRCRGPRSARRVRPHPHHRARRRPRPRRPLRRRRAGRIGGDGRRARPRPRGGPRAGRGLVPGHGARRLAPPRPRARRRRRRAAPAAPTGSSGSTATSSPPWPGRIATSSASREATCVAAAIASRRAGCSTSPRRAPGRTVVDSRSPRTPTSRGCATWPASTTACDTSTSPATEQEHRLRACSPPAARSPTPPTTPHRPRRRGDRRAPQHRVHALRRQPRRAAPCPSPVDRITSPTRLERWADCPHRHLVEDLLRAAPVENPEDTLDDHAARQGEPRARRPRALPRHRARSTTAPTAPRRARPGRRSTIGSSRRSVARSATSTRRRGLVGRPIFWARDRRRILADLDATLRADSAFRQARRHAPLAAELGFGLDVDGLPPVEVTLPDGRALRVRGRIDRIDITADGTVHVVDYKTGLDARLRAALRRRPRRAAAPSSSSPSTGWPAGSP